MVSTIELLAQGYAKRKGTTENASPSTTLIKDSNKLVLVDPGSNSQTLLAALKRLAIHPEQIEMIFLTHFHPDHFLNISLFPEKPIIGGGMLWVNDSVTAVQDKIPDTAISIIPTPGHADEHASLLINTEKEKIVIAGDVFWWYDEEEQKTDEKSLLTKEDPYANDKTALLKSRKKVLELADYIIPGHGKPFWNPKRGKK